MKKFFGEFKTFITRGNVLDMAVGVIVGGAFTAIVSGLSDHILRPIINWVLALILGTSSLEGVYTYLKTAYVMDEVTGLPTTTIDLANSIYIDWGAFINAIINFILIALVLFLIVRTINRVKATSEERKEKIKKARPTKEERKAMKEAGVDLFDRQAVAAFITESRAKAEAQAQEEARIAEEQAKLEAEKQRAENPTTEDLLKDIKALLQQNAQNK